MDKKRSLYEEYQICKIRGHTRSDISHPTNPITYICKYCGTRFRHEHKLVEHNVPKKEFDDE